MKVVVLLVIIFRLLSSGRHEQSGAVPIAKPADDTSVVFQSGPVVPLRALLQIATANRIPVGIVFGSRPTLCSEEHRFDVKADTPEEAFRQVVAGTGYKVNDYSGVYVIMAPDVAVRQINLLNESFDRFFATESTFKDSGALLSGYMVTAAGEAKGFVTNTISNGTAETFTVEVKNANTQQVANKIVSLKSKGVWIFQFGRSSNSSVQIYGYKDDSHEIEALQCE